MGVQRRQVETLGFGEMVESVVVLNSDSVLILSPAAAGSLQSVRCRENPLSTMKQMNYNEIPGTHNAEGTSTEWEGILTRGKAKFL